MASYVSYIRTNLVLVFAVPDDMGDVTFKRITLSNVRRDLTPDEINQFTIALGALSKYELHGVERVLYESID